ncbi:hypothetical protein C8F01DRAFT_1150843 [Mycena amicta]|nr:hypothetical protein C8F01DRAFT_1180563 [Mycena amicta]KAJ7057726.1 hypothetical protein C8F01DRAFT_1150843 [Mycena amicta]
MQLKLAFFPLLPLAMSASASLLVHPRQSGACLRIGAICEQGVPNECVCTAQCLPTLALPVNSSSVPASILTDENSQMRRPAKSSPRLQTAYPQSAVSITACVRRQTRTRANARLLACRLREPLA